MRYKDVADRLAAAPSLAVDANATLGAHSLAVVAHLRSCTSEAHTRQRRGSVEVWVQGLH